MPRGTALVLAVFVLLAGLAGGFFLRPLVDGGGAPVARSHPVKLWGSGDEGKTTSRDGADSSGDHSSDTPHSSGGSGPSSRDGSSHSRPDTAADADSLIERALAALGLTDGTAAPMGNETISGRITIGDDEPLPGAAVYLEPAKISLGTKPRADLTADARAALEQAARAHAMRLTAESGPDGTFRFDNLAVGEYELTPVLAGVTFRYLRSPLYQPWYGRGEFGYYRGGDGGAGAELPALVRTGTHTQFYGSRRVTTSIDILLPDGSRPPRATVYDYAWLDGSQTREWTPGARDLSLDSGGHDITASAVLPSGADYSADAVRVAVDQGVNAAPVVLHLKPVIVLKGTFKYLGARRPVQARLIAHTGSTPPTDAEMENTGMWPSYDGTGSVPPPDFGFMGERYAGTGGGGLEPGTYILAAMAYSKIVASKTVTVAASSVWVDFEIPAPEAGSDILVKLSGPAGEPVARATLSLLWKAGENGSSRDAALIADSAGLFHLPRHMEYEPDASATSVRWTVSAYSPLFGTREVEWNGRADGTVNIQFPKPSALTVRTEAPAGHDGTNIAFDLQVVTKEGDNPSYQPSQHLRSRGDDRLTFRYEGLSPGEYRVTVTLWGAPVGEPVPVSLREGENTLSFPFPSVQNVTVRFGQLRPTSYQITPESQRWSGYPDAVDRSANAVTFKNLPAGKYLLSVGTPEGNRQMNFTVPQSDDFMFVASEENALSIYIGINPDIVPILAATKLRSGDIIIACGGRPLTGQDPIAELKTRTGVLHLEVARGGETVRVELAVEALVSALDSGLLNLYRVFH
jgi:hypothetical protein